MSAGDALSVIALITVVWAMIYAAIDIRRAPPDKRLLRMFDALLFLYLVIVYALALSTDNVYLVRSGILTRFGMIVVVFLFILELYTERRKHANRTD